jgi:hypothetical protein
MIKSVRTIPFFVVLTSSLCSLHASSVMLAGHLSPAPDEVLRAVQSGPITQPTVGGIKMTYAGYVDSTNNDGYFSFPWHNAQNELRIIITAETDFDRLKNTVSQLTSVKADKRPALRVFRVTKQTETERDAEAKPQQEGPLALKSFDPSQWYFKVSDEGTTLGDKGLSSQDLIIHCDPKHIYMQDGSMHFAEENSHFIIPHEVIYVLSTPPAFVLSDNDKDQLSLSVDANRIADEVKEKQGELMVKRAMFGR